MARTFGGQGICYHGSVPRSRMDRIRACIRDRRYDITAHAMEEMAEDGLDISDLEASLVNGKIARIERADPRGTRFVIHGTAGDGSTQVGVVGRFVGNTRFLVITVYEIS